MARYLKRGMDASAIKAADAKVRATVEQILEQIETGGDAAVRELSQQFDNWSPPSFKLAASEVERAISQVAKRDLDDYIGFVTTFLLAFGIALQFPVILYLLARVGILSYAFLSSRRR